MDKIKLRPGSLTDKEVSLVLTLLKEEKYEQQEILGFINAIRTNEKRSLTNNGRITEVNYIVTGRTDKLSKGKLDRYSQIKPAGQNEIKSFLEACESLGAYDNSSHDPLSDSSIKRIVKIKTDNPLCLDITETDKIECKKSFDAPIKTIAAFANNKGGYFLFGVEDKTWSVVGLADTKFEIFDLKSLNTIIRSKLGADLQIQKRVIQIQNKKIGVLYVDSASIKPLIFINGEGSIAQGHIYYRYPGEDRLIAPQDLQRLIEERIKQLSETILLKHISNILKAGIENAAVVNLETGEVDAKSGNFIIDEDLLPRLSFVKEGEFVEKSGAPTLRLIGDIKSTSKVITTVKENLLKLYPYSWKEMSDEVRKKNDKITTNQINDLIGKEGMKSNKLYSAYNFRNKKQQDSFEKTGMVTGTTPSIYNQKAVDFILDKYKTA